MTNPENVRTSNFIAYRVSEWPAMSIVPAARQRQWMDATPNRFAYRCLPLLMANQHGWLILNSHRFIATWDGGQELAALKVECSDGRCPASSHFGSGILTWYLPWLFRTPQGVNLLVRGTSNWPKDGAVPLDGLIESDWSVTTFTMNWKITRKNMPVIFEKGEPIAMLVPQNRHELEGFNPSETTIDSNPQLAEEFRIWSRSRGEFMKQLTIKGSEAAKTGWQKHYTKGILPSEVTAPEHQSRLELRDFKGQRHIGLLRINDSEETGGQAQVHDEVRCTKRLDSRPNPTIAEEARISSHDKNGISLWTGQDIYNILTLFRPLAVRQSQLSAEQIERIVACILPNAPINLLVFGVGDDAAFWNLCNKGGRTVFLEDDASWINRAKELLVGAQICQIDYTTRLDQWEDNLSLPNGWPGSLQNTRWDLILIDGPKGYKAGLPGRQQSIWCAKQLQSSRTHVFLHDYERGWERRCADTYLGAPQHLVPGPHGLLAEWSAPDSAE